MVESARVNKHVGSEHRLTESEIMDLIGQSQGLVKSEEKLVKSEDRLADTYGSAAPLFGPGGADASGRKKGLAATPQVQEEEGSMFDFNMDDITKYVSNIFSSSPPPAIEEPVSRTKSVQKPTGSPHLEVEEDGGPPADDSFDEAILHTIRYYEGAPILKARKPVEGDPYTVGYGRTRDDKGNLIKKGAKITEEQADRYLREDVKKRMPELRKAYPDFNSYPAEVQQHMASSYYRGTLTPNHSPKTRKLINAGKFKEAAAELLDNNEYRNAKKNNRAGIRERMEDTATALLSMEPARQAARGGRLASNPNPYEPKAI
tara:strand:+ start:3628 stop:4578 length:951 start_codon:yes stop_codon:yes gene_type:complete